MDNILEALNRDPAEMSSTDIDKIIAFFRKSRQNFEAGIKPKKEGADIDLVSILNIKPKISSDRRD